MVTIHFENEIDVSLLKSTSVAILGYGNQGHAHALNLRDSGVEVIVGSQSKQRAISDGFSPLTLSEATQQAEILMLSLPDILIGDIYEQDIAPHLRAGQCLLLAHGFSLVYRLFEPRPEVDVALVSPKGPGAKLRENYLSGNGFASLVAVYQNPTGRAEQIALAYSSLIGAAKGGAYLTSVQNETETDLFGEQAILCGGIPQLLLAGFETLVDAGYPPELAYFECIHEAKLITDLIYSRGFAGMRQAISDTAAWGGFQGGNRVITDETRQAMKDILKDVRSGDFSAEWLQEHRSGRKTLEKLSRAESEHLAESTGQKIRERFLKGQN